MKEEFEKAKSEAETKKKSKQDAIGKANAQTQQMGSSSSA
jgi:hypothetical protein